MSALCRTFARAGTPWMLLLAAALVCACGCPARQSSSKSAQQSSDARAAADERAIKSIGNREWYDARSATYRAPSVPADLDHPLRSTGTLAGPSSTNTVPTGGGGRRGISFPSGEAIAYAILVTLGIALVGVAILLAVISVRNWRPLPDNPDLFKSIDIDPTRVADLPFEAQVEMQDPLAYARHLVSKGAYDEAILFLYGYMLLALDRAGKIVLHRGKTNRMYLHELYNERQLREMLVPAMLAFEDVFFGRHSLEPQRFLKIWAQLDNFHRAMAPAIAELASSDSGQAVAP